MRSRGLGIMLGLVLGVIILVLHARLTGPRKWNLLPEDEGRITSIALQYASSADELMLPVYRAFLREIGSDVEVLAVCGNSSDARRFRRLTKGWGIERPERIRTVEVGSPITGWCKDRFLVARASRNNLICPRADASGLGARINDALVAPVLAHAYPGRYTAVHADLDFDAGDFLQTRSRVIVSDVLWRRNGSPPNFQKRLAGMFEQKVIYLDGAPDHHIGMYAAPLDERAVIVGDPRMARKLWTPRMDAEFGHPDFSPATIARFDRMARQLGGSFPTVIRAPLVVLGPRVYITYTNCVFETRGRRHIGYIPTYGIPELDRAGTSAFSAAGCQVRPIPVGKLYRFRGTIGCMINVLDRR